MEISVLDSLVYIGGWDGGGRASCSDRNRRCLSFLDLASRLDGMWQGEALYTMTETSILHSLT